MDQIHFRMRFLGGILGPDEVPFLVGVMVVGDQPDAQPGLLESLTLP